jgi:hypothetical protein
LTDFIFQVSLLVSPVQVAPIPLYIMRILILIFVLNVTLGLKKGAVIPNVFCVLIDLTSP